MKHAPPSPLAAAICETAVQHICARLLAGVDALETIAQEQRVDEAIVGLRLVESLGAEETVRYQQLIGHKAGKQIADAVRLSREALNTTSGHRMWFAAVHERASNLFNRALIDYADGSDRDPLRLLVAQTVLIAVTHARGLLGMPKEASAKRKPVAAREFEPADYPDPTLREAIVLAAFGDDNDSVATLRTFSCTPDHDEDGRVTLLLAAHASDDVELKAALRRLAARIIAEAPDCFTVQRRVRPSPPPTSSVSLLERARQAARGDL